MKYGYWNELWQSRHLCILLIRRNLSLRYKQAILGTAWGVLRPLLIILVFTFVFTVIVDAPSDTGVPYFLLVATALIPWNFFSLGITEASTSLLSHHALISKTYVPRLLFPIAAIGVHLIECVIAFCILALLATFWGIFPTSNLLAFPFLLLLLTIVTTGLGVFLAVFNVKYRDTKHLLPILLQAGILVSPIGFTSMVIPNEWKQVLFLNPLAGLLEGFRWCFLGTDSHFTVQLIVLPFLMGLLICSIGIWYFRKNEGTVADFL